METITINVPDITCDHCLATIKKVLTALPGVQWIVGDAEAKTVAFKYEPQRTSLEAIEKTLADEDYPVGEVGVTGDLVPGREPDRPQRNSHRHLLLM